MFNLIVNPGRLAPVMVLLAMFVAPAAALAEEAETVPAGAAATVADTAAGATPVEVYVLPETTPRAQVSAGVAYCLLPGETASVTIQPGDFLPYGAEMSVPDTAEIEITVADAGRVSLKGGSKSALLRDAAGLLLYLDEGTAHSLLDRLNGREFTVVTPALTAGVRGTEFEVTAELDGTVEVQVDTGAVSVDNQLTGEELTVRAGSAARAALGERLARAGYRRAAAREKRRAELKAMPAGLRLRPDLNAVLQRMEVRQAESQRRVDTAAARLQQLQRERERLATSTRRRDRIRLAQIGVQLGAAQRELARRELQLTAVQRWLAQQGQRADLTAEQRTRLTQATDRVRDTQNSINRRVRPLLVPASR